MTDLVPDETKPTICFDLDDAHWLFLSLQTTVAILSEELAKRGKDPMTSEAYQAYLRLEDLSGAFWREHSASG